ncbi:SAC3/GANP/Nin1/mts3/eIF-3 p25 family-domain-containing protein [Podospora aff. communis PSN243]|uniref:SAC3/GANP/Nin1/mts3/eIF-3 p25 family-domain-containing protein n=1 Tax=Podospora aff. communis PSN243 TaxID=3040156 RepID=A0AAV9H661_9PEZI|nr:SAC3/GANP/Nin1/mts3/eIF-3 p25 family-domain-containing protein [Podospora aff. communis PSN243]
MAGPFNSFGSPFGANSTAPSSNMNNPFGAPVGRAEGGPVFGAPRNPTTGPSSNPFGAPSPSTNPFLTPQTASSNKPSIPTQNPFGNSPAQPTFGSAFPASQPPNGPPPSAPTIQPPSPFGAHTTNTMPGAGMNATTKSGFGGGQGQSANPSVSTPFNTQGRKPPTGPAANGINGRTREPLNKFQPGQKENGSRPEKSMARPASTPLDKSAPSQGPTDRTKELSPFAYNYANKLYEHLQKENIRAPKWPSDIGNPSNRAAVEGLKDAYKKYRTRVYESLRKADLIDDPEKRRKLADALPYKGICEDMCPEFEQISRIAEHDVKREEKETQPDGFTDWAIPSKMLKKFGRSAAGQDAPLPMDVRSVDALRRSVDYMFNDILGENNLPSMHNFLWDRTRAVRRDFTFHSQKSAEEMKDLVYCFETITRFHATALHLLSRKGHAQDDFDDKQEIEQLGRTILSLVEAYDTCREMGVQCENEPEFRAYYLLLNANDPSIVKRIPTWGKEYWFESEEVQTAYSLLQVMEDVRQPRGPIKPRRGMTLADTAFTNYFTIVEDPRVSYTMACVAEVHFTSVRQNILRNLVRGYARNRDAPRTLSAVDLNKMLRFDTPEEAVEFAEAHNFEFSTDYPEGKTAPPAPYLLLNNKRKHVPSPRISHAFSGELVERKRGTSSLTHVIYNTVYEDVAEKPKQTEISPDSMFVSQHTPPPSDTSFSSVFSKPAVPPVAQSPPAASAFNQPAMQTLGQPVATASQSAGNPFGQPPTSTPPPPTTSPSVQPATSTPGFGTASGQTAASTGVLGKAPSQTTTTSFTTPTVGKQSLKPEEPPLTQTNAAQATTPATPSPFPFLSQPVQTSSSTPAPSAVGQPPNPTPTSPSILGLGKVTTTPASVLKSNESSPFMTSPSSEQTATAPKSVTFGPSSILGSTPTTTTPLSAPTAQIPKPLQHFKQPAAPAPTPGQAATSSIPSISVTTPTPASNTGQASVESNHSASLPSMSSFGIQQPSPSAPAQASRSAQPAQPVRPPSNGVLGAIPPRPSLFAPPTDLPRPPAKDSTPKPDLMGGLTNWYVMGDQGLMEQFTEFTLQNLVAEAFRQWEVEEAEKKRKEEDDLSWKEARQFRTYSLGVKYFYKWQENARARATRRILSQGKEKLRLYREQQRIEKQKVKEEAEKAERQARREAKRRIAADGQQLAALASSERSRRTRTEEQLLASGIFSGLRDERGAAHRAIKETGWGDGSTVHSYAESELELQPRRLSTSTRGPAGSPDSTDSKREGWKTRSLREKFGIEHRRSTSASGSVFSSSRLRQSLPALTNFSRKRSATASEEEREAKRNPHSKTNGFKTRHWDLRSRGFVPMPDGQWLPESIAKASRASDSGGSFDDNGPSFRKSIMGGPPSDYGGSIAGSTNDNALPTSVQRRLEKLKRGRITHSNGFRSRSGSDVYDASSRPFAAREESPGKRKRDSTDDEGGRADGSSPSASKKVYVSREDANSMIKDVQKMVQELNQAMDVLEEDRVFFRGQSGVLGDGS